MDSLGFQKAEIMKKAERGTLFFYGLPACGHTFSNLYLAGSLAAAGFRVVYYSSEPFREVIRENGCEYRAYPMDWGALDLSDGERILKLYRLILQYTWEMLPILLAQVKEDRPCAVIFDSLGLWGRAIGQICSLPSFAFYSIAAIDWTWGYPGPKRRCPAKAGSREWRRVRENFPGRRPAKAGSRECHCVRANFPGKHSAKANIQGGHCVGSGFRRLPHGPWGKGLGAYAPGFSADFLRYAGELPGALKYARRLKERYGLKKLGLLPVLMNRGDYNLCGYSRQFQPGGRGFGSEYIFVGPLAVHRKIMWRNDFSCTNSGVSEPLIYISLGTIFNRNEVLLQAVIDQLGKRSREKNFSVVLVWEGERTFPENFVVRPFVNQNEILQHAALFITAAGMNSIHEALYFGVPCLLCPQQGEQLLNARQFEKLGFGRILKNPDRLWQEALACMELKKHWDEKRRRRMTDVSVGKVMELFEACGEESNG